MQPILQTDRVAVWTGFLIMSAILISIERDMRHLVNLLEY